VQSARITLLLLLIASASSCSDRTSRQPQIHPRWKSLGIPVDRVTRVLDVSDEHGLFANYSGYRSEELLAIVSARLLAAGYEKVVCKQFDGRVFGFRKGNDELGVKIMDLPEHEVALGVFDPQSIDGPLLGVCLGKYTLGEPQFIR